MNGPDPAVVAAWDQTWAGHSERLDLWIGTHIEGAGQFDELTNLGAMAKVLYETDRLTRMDIADMLVIAISRLAAQREAS